jgi:hypothetical protein
MPKGPFSAGTPSSFVLKLPRTQIVADGAGYFTPETSLSEAIDKPLVAVVNFPSLFIRNRSDSRYGTYATLSLPGLQL